MAAITNVTNQLLHNTLEPLDSTLQVENEAQLLTPSIVQPYVGKMVHVKSKHAIYVCAEVPTPTTAVWRPVMSDDGKAFFITSASGDVFKITAVRDAGNVGRLQVTYPAF